MMTQSTVRPCHLAPNPEIKCESTGMQLSARMLVQHVWSHRLHLQPQNKVSQNVMTEEGPAVESLGCPLPEAPGHTEGSSS